MRNAKMTIWIVAAVVCLAAPQVIALTQFNDGGTHNIDYEINDDVWVDYNAPAMETTVNFLDGGSMPDSYQLQAYEDSRINISGGSIYNLHAYDKTLVNVSSGSIGGNALWAHDSSQITVSGGSINKLTAYNSSLVDMSGGSITYYLSAKDSSRITMSGVSIGSSLQAWDSSRVAISSGSIGDDLEVINSSQITVSGGEIGDYIWAYHYGILTIYGSDFAVDGQPVGYGELTSIFGAGIDNEPHRQLTGILSSGDLIDNGFRIDTDAKIVLAPAPPYYTLTMNVEPNDVGINTVTPDVGDHNCAGTMPISAERFVACPDVYVFDYWDGDVNDVNDPNTTVCMDSDKTVTAYFMATRECGDECHPYPSMDHNQDCIVDFKDFAIFCQSWLECTKPECD